MSTLLATLSGTQGLHGRANFGSLLGRPLTPLAIWVSAARAVLRAVGIGPEKLKVVDPVVLPVTVLVVDVLVTRKHPTKVLGHAQAVFHHVAGGVRHWMVRHSQPDVAVAGERSPSTGSASAALGYCAVFVRSFVNASWHSESPRCCFSLKYNTLVKWGL